MGPIDFEFRVYESADGEVHMVLQGEVRGELTFSDFDALASFMDMLFDRVQAHDERGLPDDPVSTYSPTFQRELEIARMSVSKVM